MFGVCVCAGVCVWGGGDQMCGYICDCAQQSHTHVSR